MFGPTFSVSQWCIEASLAGHSCGNSAIFPMASLLSSLSGRPVAKERVGEVGRECKRHGKAAPWIVSCATSAVLGGLRISVANSSSHLRSGGLAGIRTRDLQIKSPLLYQLSYEPTYARWEGVAPMRTGAFGQAVPAIAARSDASPGLASRGRFRRAAQGRNGACEILGAEWSSLMMPRCPHSTR